MNCRQSVSAETLQYSFIRVKDTHEENHVKFITLFARLIIKNAYGTKNIWVEIDEVKWEQASEKLKKMPDAMHSYTVNEPVFKELLRLSNSCYKELYSLTPYHKTSEFRKLG